MSDSATLRTAACQALLSMEFSRQEYLSELPCPPPDLPNSGIELASLKSPALAGMFFTTSAPWEALLLLLLSRFSRVQLLATPWTAAHQAPPSMGFSRQEYLSELPCPPPDLPDQGIELASLKSPALAGMFLTTSAPWEALLLL